MPKSNSSSGGETPVKIKYKKVIRKVPINRDKFGAGKAT